MDTPPPPTTWRVVAAFLLVPAVASLIVACVMPLYAGLPNLSERFVRTAFAYGVFGAYPPTLVLGVPAYLLLRHRVAPSLGACALVGALVAAVPWVVLASLSNPDFASINGRPTVVGGVKTLWGWFEMVRMGAVFGACGSLGGAIFWLVAAAGVRRAKA